MTGAGRRGLPGALATMARPVGTRLGLRDSVRRRIVAHGAARVAPARRDLTPGLPRRLLHREGSGREAVMQDGGNVPAFPDADGEYGQLLADALIVLSDAAINKLVEEKLAAWMAAGRHERGGLVVSGNAFISNGDGSREHLELGIALEKRAKLFLLDLRAGVLQAHHTDRLIGAIWQLWRPEDWRWLGLEIWSAQHDGCLIRSREDGGIFLSEYVRVRLAEPATRRISQKVMPAAEAATPEKSPGRKTATVLNVSKTKGGRKPAYEWDALLPYYENYINEHADLPNELTPQKINAEMRRHAAAIFKRSKDDKVKFPNEWPKPVAKLRRKLCDSSKRILKEAALRRK